MDDLLGPKYFWVPASYNVLKHLEWHPSTFVSDNWRVDAAGCHLQRNNLCIQSSGLSFIWKPRGPLPSALNFSVQQRLTPLMKEAIIKKQHSERGRIQVYLYHLLEHSQSLMHIICKTGILIVLLNAQWSQFNWEMTYVWSDNPQMVIPNRQNKVPLSPMTATNSTKEIGALKTKDTHI